MNRLVFACVVLAAGCGPGVHDLNDEPEVLFTIRATLEGVPSIADPDARLRAAVLWAGVPQPNFFCLENGPNPLVPSRVVTSSVARVGCSDPLAFVPGVMGPSVAISPEATSVEIPLYHLPPSDALIGPITGRIGYGSIIVFDDRDDDRTLSGLDWCEDTEAVAQDSVLAASFSTIARRHERLVYREGDFDEDSFFYPAIGCPAPRAGLSVWRLEGLFNGDCLSEPITTSFALEYERTARALDSVRCVPRRRNGRPRPAEDDPKQGVEDPTRIVDECLDAETYAMTLTDCRCPRVNIFTLRGCFNDLTCDEPDWDFRDNPPPWWPCSGTP